MKFLSYKNKLKLLIAGSVVAVGACVSSIAFSLIVNNFLFAAGFFVLCICNLEIMFRRLKELKKER